jgi:putative flippase GtrA
MLGTVAWISLIAAFASALTIAVDEVRHPQRMWIMNLVWPITALYFSIFAVWVYFRIGRRPQHEAHASMQHTAKHPDPTWQQTAVATSHCGAGCTVGDIVAEFSIMGLGLRLFGSPLYASFAADLFLAWLLGIAFQYFSIKPMRHLSSSQALVAALKADTLSILAFEVGLFGWMALTYFVLFPNPHLEPNQALYWLMMQIGMVIGFLTSYPMNRVLVRWGTKEAMG